MNKRILIFGGSGLVGSCLKSCFASSKTYLTYREQKYLKSATDIAFSISSASHLAENIQRVLDLAKPDVVINPLAMTNVDQCELNPAQSELINSTFPKLLAEKLDPSTHLYHISTDFVFGGDKSDYLYTEQDPTHAVNLYAQHKLQAEESLLKSGKSVSILRTALVYGNDMQKENYLPKFLRLIREGVDVNLVSDHKRTPTYAPDIARWIYELVENDMRPQLLHLAGSEVYTFEQFIRQACDVLHINHSSVGSLHSSEINAPAIRPESTPLSDTERKRILKFPATPLQKAISEIRIR